ncbi:metallophosphoesterase family protein [Paenibacillus cremeus]|uniref:Metallophosphoesterase family protein n=1 Tax=Paenibacillus cremeus TaxID=2163881 RepID=A0A559K705_9BACL|nr:metallophosphoesterase family protein [Paenibacillus cremeus]TVY07897.1 metallophosphoesterase family protein [Paenibacillus cremeus]
MKAAFISDIHGNAVALEAVLADIAKKDVSRVYVLGDLIFRGPEPKRALDLVRSLQTEVIKGNADEWVVRGVRQGEVPEQALELMNQERNWTVAQLDEADLHYLGGLPTELHIQLGAVFIHAFHATPFSLFEIVPPDTEDTVLEEKLMSAAEADIYVYAHIHRPYIRYIGGKTLINLGSVGLPFDGMPKASYAIVEVSEGNVSTSIERVSFSNEKVIELYEQVQYPNSAMMAGIIQRGSIK